MILTCLHMWAVAMVIVMMTTPSAGEEGELECGRKFTHYHGRGYEGEIESPGYPSNYPNNVRCGYHLSTEQGGTIELRFTDFDLESHRLCDWDYVQVYDGSTTTGSLIIEERLCGSVIPATIHSTLDSMYVLFVTDSRVQHRGFHAVWSANGTTAPPATVSLVRGTPYAGTVLVTLVGGKTGYICDRNFTKQDADVVCRMLGYSESYKRYSSNSTDFTDPSTHLFVVDLHCRDHEREIFQCPIGNTTECSLDDVARVECYEPPPVSLVGGPTNNSGTVVITANGHAGDMGPVCSPWWGLMEGNVVCRMLGYSGASSVSRYNHYNYKSSSPFMLDGIKCRGNESNIMDCPVESFPGQSPRVNLTCTIDDTAGVQCYDVDDTPIDAAGCGLLPLIGNRETDTDLWPQVCNITTNFASRYALCLGTLVKNSHGNFYLVTLASCVDNFPDPDFYRATCGKINTNGDSYLQVLQFKQITRHPGYGRYNRGEDNDIAVLSFMFQPVENDYVQAACITHEDHVGGEVGTIVDWSQYYEDYNLKYTLLQLNLTIFPDEHCTTDDFNKYSKVCTGTVESEHHGGYCDEFPGSPMFTNRGGKWTLTGIGKKVYNKGYGPCSDSKYIITDVYDMRVWLDQQINGCY